MAEAEQIIGSRLARAQSGYPVDPSRAKDGTPG